MNDAKAYNHERASNFMLSLPCFMIFGLIAYAAYPFIEQSVTRQAEQVAAKQSRAALADQLREIKAGKTNALVHPAPQFIDDVFADAECAAKIRDVYLGGDVSDPRLARLVTLPNLKSLIILGVFDEKQCDDFLERIQGDAAIEELCLERSFLSSKGFDCIARFLTLKTLSVYDGPDCLKPFKDHPNLEKISLTTRSDCEGLIPILRTIPHIREIAVFSDAEKSKLDSLEKNLRESFPNCKFEILQDGR